jgi:hypothetical protein
MGGRTASCLPPVSLLTAPVMAPRMVSCFSSGFLDSSAADCLAPQLLQKAAESSSFVPQAIQYFMNFTPFFFFSGDFW